MSNLPRVLFLDFDGVLHPTPCEVDKLFCHLELLESWLRAKPEVGVVISSSWRAEHPIDEIRSYFSPDLEARVIGAAPVFNERPSPIDERHREILHWLQARPGQVYRWAILDDQFDRFPLGYPELVATDGAVGLTAADLRRLDSVLGYDTSKDKSDRTEAEFRARGEQAWQEYQRTGQSSPASDVFDRVQERIDARRQDLLAKP